MPCGLARCPGAKSTRFSTIPIVSFSHAQAISSRLQCNTADFPSGRWAPTLPSQYPGYRRKQSTWPWNSSDSFAFLVLEMMWTSTALYLGFPIISKYPSFITSNYWIQQIWSILNASQKVQTQFLAMFFFFNWQQFWNHFSQTFLMFNFSLRIVEHFLCPNWLPQLLFEHPTFGLFESHLALFQSCHR